ncbi:MAG TPA: hypothetical protein PLV42_01355 [bacterium]|nr:hypothetical protein [bacterium]
MTLKYLFLFLLVGVMLPIACNHANPSRSDADSSIGDDAVVMDDTVETETDDFILEETEATLDEDALDETIQPDEVGCYVWRPDGDPYGDMEAKAYSYYGDFDVVVKDPENVRSWWAQIYEGYDETGQLSGKPVARIPKPYDTCSSLYPFEAIIIDDENPWSPTACENRKITDAQLTSTCDTVVTHECWEQSWLYGSDPSYHVENGKIVLALLSGSTYFREAEGTYVYDIKKKQVIKVSNGTNNTAINDRNEMLLSIYNPAQNWEFKDLPLYDPYLYAKLVYYNIETATYAYAWHGEKFYYAGDIGMSDTYAIVTIQHEQYENKGQKVYYTKIGEWDNWKELIADPSDTNPLNNRAGWPKLNGSKVTYYTPQLKVFYCDLAVGQGSCVQVSKPGENARKPLLTKDGKKIIYGIGTADGSDGEYKIIEADIVDPQAITYKTLVTHDKAAGPSDIATDVLLYSKRIGALPDGKYLVNHCYYRFSDGKNFCLDDARDQTIRKEYGYIWDKYYVYQSMNDIVVRDMDCYCKIDSSRCPYAEIKMKKR